MPGVLLFCSCGYQVTHVKWEHNLIWRPVNELTGHNVLYGDRLSNRLAATKTSLRYSILAISSAKKFWSGSMFFNGIGTHRTWDTQSLPRFTNSKQKMDLTEKVKLQPQSQYLRQKGLEGWFKWFWNRDCCLQPRGPGTTLGV